MTFRPTYEELVEKISALEADIARQKKLEDGLRESRSIYETMLDRSLVGIYVAQDRKFRIMNPIALSYTGFSLEELIGEKSNMLIHPDDRDWVKQIAGAMLRGQHSHPFEYRITTKQKEIRWMLGTVALILFEGRPAILGNAMDITERHNTERKLRESENLYRTIFETTGSATIIIGEDMIIDQANTEFEKLTGYLRTEWVKKRKWTEHIAPEDLPRMKEYHRLRRKDPSAAPRNYEYCLIDSQGKRRNIFITVDLIPGTTKSIAAFTDITEWKRTENDLKLKSRNLEELNTALRVLLKQREGDQGELEEKVLSNVKQFVLPYVEKIKKGQVDAKSMAYINILESNLSDIISPFSRKLSSKYMNLTPKEIQVANLIRDGKTSKEIAEILNVSSSTVDIHRHRIRNKLGLRTQKFNLRSHLASL